MWLGQVNQIDPFMMMKNVLFSTFWKSTSGDRLSLFRGKCPFSDSGFGSPGCLPLQCTLWLESSWAMFSLRQLYGDLDRIYQGQVTCFKWRPGPPVSSSQQNRQARVRRKPSRPGNSNSLAPDRGFHKEVSARAFQHGAQWIFSGLQPVWDELSVIWNQNLYTEKEWLKAYY